jgi:hypothetical protein
MQIEAVRSRVPAAHHKRSTILITNIDFDAWASYLGDAPLATARGTIIARSPNGAVSASSPLTLRAVATRLSPGARTASARARPIPRELPVINQV